MAREETGVILTIGDIPYAPDEVDKPSRKMKKVASEAHKEIYKPPKKKVVTLVQKEGYKVVSSIVLMPTKTRNEAYGKAHMKTTSSYVV